jgi:hypothetical protein
VLSAGIFEGFVTVDEQKRSTGRVFQTPVLAPFRSSTQQPIPGKIRPGRAGHKSQAVHRAYAKRATFVIPALEDYGTKSLATETVGPWISKPR